MPITDKANIRSSNNNVNLQTFKKTSTSFLCSHSQQSQRRWELSAYCNQFWLPSILFPYISLSGKCRQYTEQEGSKWMPSYSVPSLSGGPSILLRAFFCIGACVRAFIYCLPVLCIDGTFLTGKYKGTILTAIGIDCNKEIVHIVFSFVENENTESWYWFLERLKIHVVAGKV